MRWLKLQALKVKAKISAANHITEREDFEPVGAWATPYR
jgi:hypothetical protein